MAESFMKTLKVEAVYLMEYETFDVSILGLADRILSDRPEIASFASLFVLSSEHLNLGNTVQAHKYANLAFSLAATDIEKVEARRLVARTLLRQGKGRISSMLAAISGRRWTKYG